MKKLLLSLAAGFACLMPAAGAQPQGGRTVMAVFAHPDDESTMGGTLAKMAREGIQVKLVTVTSGQKGGKEPGEKLGRLREGELKEACRELGIGEPELLGFQDGTVSFEKQDEIKTRIARAIDRFRPEVLVTFGPEGVTGHADHIAVGKLATEVAREKRRQAGYPQRIFHVAIPRSKAGTLIEVASGQALTEKQRAEALSKMAPDEKINVGVDIRSTLEAKRKSASRHKSQFPPPDGWERWLKVFGQSTEENFVQVEPAPKAGERADRLFP